MGRLAILVVLATRCWASDWIRVASPDVEVLTDAGERTGRRLHSRFEQIHDVFLKGLLPGVGGRTWPVRAFAFASLDEFDSYRDARRVDGFYTNGAERGYIALYAGGDASRVAFHEYVHLVLNHSAVRLPLWFEEGTAEFYSTLEIDASQLRVGLPIDSHVNLLSGVRWLTAAELAAVNTESSHYRESERAGIFYAESWALVHMLNQSPAWREGMRRFFQLLGEERPPDEAFRVAFQRPMKDALAELPAYLRSMRSAVLKATIESPSKPQVTALTRVDAALERGDLALTVHRALLARSLLEKLPESPEALAGLARVEISQGHLKEARQGFERAIGLGSRDATMYFEYAMLERDSEAAPQRVRALLEKSAVMNPDLADAQYLLGVEKTDEGSYPAAIDHLRQAVRVLPRRSDYWHALAYAQSKQGDRENALQSARRAVATSETEAQMQNAEAMVLLAESEAPQPVAKGPAVITPPSWQNRKGDASLEGTLTQVDCDGASARLHILPERGNEIIVEVHHPGEVELVNAPQSNYQFSCGAQRLYVVIGYVAADREVTRIEFRH